MELQISETEIGKFREHLTEMDLNPNTVKKYVLDIEKLKAYLEEQDDVVNRVSIAAYLEKLKQEGYKLYTLNTIAASINAYSRFIGHPELQCSHFKIRRNNNLDRQSQLTAEEYESLIHAAREQGDFFMVLLIQVIASTELRMNELQYLTVESLEDGVVQVLRSGEAYDIYLSDDLLGGLCSYAKHQQKQSGIIFCGKNGKVVDRKSLWRSFKKLAEQAGVNPEKVCARNLKKQLNKEYIPVDFSRESQGGEARVLHNL
jgi:site-specific recombinase XerD